MLDQGRCLWEGVDIKSYNSCPRTIALAHNLSALQGSLQSGVCTLLFMFAPLTRPPLVTYQIPERLASAAKPRECSAEEPGMQSKRTLTGNSSRVCFDISRASSVGIMYPVRCTFQACPVYNSPLVQKASKPEAQRSKTTAHNTLRALLKRLLPTPSAPLPPGVEIGQGWPGNLASAPPPVSQGLFATTLATWQNPLVPRCCA